MGSCDTHVMQEKHYSYIAQQVALFIIKIITYSYIKSIACYKYPVFVFRRAIDTDCVGVALCILYMIAKWLISHGQLTLIMHLTIIYKSKQPYMID